MGAFSIIMAIFAGLCMVFGLLTTLFPVVGSVFSFSAVALALVGIVLGGTAMSNANKQGRPSSAASVGVVLNVLTLVPALLFAFTCGMCNAFFSSAWYNVVTNPYGLNMNYDAAIAPPAADSSSKDQEGAVEKLDLPPSPPVSPPVIPPPPISPGPRTTPPPPPNK